VSLNPATFDGALKSRSPASSQPFEVLCSSQNRCLWAQLKSETRYFSGVMGATRRR